MKTATVIVAWNGAEHLPACLDSLVADDCDIVVVDNGSTDRTPELVREFAANRRRRVELLQSAENVGFTRGANLGLQAILDRAEHDAILLLNQDARLKQGCLASFAELAAGSPRVGAIGARILYPDGITLQHAGGHLELPRLVGVHHGHHEIDRGAYPTTEEVDFVTGAVMLLRTRALMEVGIFDEIFSPGYYEDVELCARLRAAEWRIAYCAEAVAIHVESASFRDPFQRQQLHHRNRIFYALPFLLDSGLARAFTDAERQSLEDLRDLDSLRATAAGYFEAMLRLDEAVKARLPSAHRGRSAQLELLDLLTKLREHCLDQLHRRRSQQSLDQL